MNGEGMEHPIELLSALLDGELSARERRSVESHLQGCEGCRSILADLRSVDGALGAEEAPPVPGSLAGRILGRAGETRVAPEPRPLPRITWFRLPMAAAAVLAGVLALWVAYIGMEGMTPEDLQPETLRTLDVAAEPEAEDDAARARHAFAPPPEEGSGEGDSGRGLRAPVPEAVPPVEDRQPPGKGEITGSAGAAPAGDRPRPAAAPGKKRPAAPPPVDLDASEPPRRPASPESGRREMGDVAPEAKGSPSVLAHAEADAVADTGTGQPAAAGGPAPMLESQAVDPAKAARRVAAETRPEESRSEEPPAPAMAPRRPLEDEGYRARLESVGFSSQPPLEPRRLFLVRGEAGVSLSEAGELTVTGPGYTCSILLETRREELRPSRTASEAQPEEAPEVPSLFESADRALAGGQLPAEPVGGEKASALIAREGAAGVRVDRPAGEEMLLMTGPDGSVTLLHSGPAGPGTDAAGSSPALADTLRRLAAEIYRARLEGTCGTLPEDLRR